MKVAEKSKYIKEVYKIGFMVLVVPLIPRFMSPTNFRDYKLICAYK